MSTVSTGVLLLLSVLLPALQPCSADGRGTLFRVNSHVEEAWSVQDTGSRLLYHLPAQPVDSSGKPIPAGSSWCLLSAANNLTCSSVQELTITAIKAPVKATNVRIRLLVAAFRIGSGCPSGGASATDVTNAYLGARGHAFLMESCSYGQMVYDKTALKVVEVTAPCDRAFSSCDDNRIADLGMQLLERQLGADVVNSYTHFSFVLPNNNGCNWAGLALVPGQFTWYPANADGIFNLGTVMQEALHNFGLYHGWRNGREYEDLSTSMGLGSSCPSAPELYRLGWATPADTLSGGSLPEGGVYREYRLPATHLTGRANMLRVLPDWLGSGYNKNMYFALRQRAGGDWQLQDEFNNKVNVHVADSSVDNAFTSQDDPKFTIVDTIGAGEARDFTAYRLAVRAGRLRVQHAQPAGLAATSSSVTITAAAAAEGFAFTATASSVAFAPTAEDLSFAATASSVAFATTSQAEPPAAVAQPFTAAPCQEPQPTAAGSEPASS
ncbi:hypothetical protein GPECTOR_55g263 [Gonium pectorale]|uniref:Peptidase M11 gametolysin domain-containing protein n=1 Tax=Gonium pectorale TaxID=33097 RepID=A0A150G684_GONPE|nr:hypothetical protein GPECTOR_55g263 [Gonium pectorale]|eukprot:KXZ45357.1 hypothetical protein GPECTOR_55g263 [Gonium pectorale]